MKLKLALFALLLTLIPSLEAKFEYKLLEIDKDDILRKTLLKTEGKTSTLMIVTSKKLSKKIKFTPYVLVIENGEKKSLTPIELAPLSNNDEGEERVIGLHKIDVNNVLLLTTSDNKKANTMVLRVLSASGEVLSQKLFSNTDNNFFNCLIQQDKIYLSFRDFEAKSHTYMSLDKELNAIGEVNVDLNKLGQYSNGFMIHGDDMYALYTNPIKSDDDLSNAQFRILKLNLAKSELVKEFEFVNKKYFSNFRFFKTAKGIEVICLSSSSVSNQNETFISSLQITWDKMELTMKNAETDVKKLLSLSAGKPLGFGGMNHRISMNVVREINADYTFIFRLAFETVRSISEPQSGGGYKTYDYYAASFEKGLVFSLDSNMSNMHSTATIPNAFQNDGKNSSRFYLFNEPVSDFNQIVFANDTSKHLLMYVTGITEGAYKLCIQVKQNNKYSPEPANVVDLDAKINAFFYQRTIEELSPGEFVLKVYHRGEGDRLLVFKAE
ncbi:MAG TPA: hypothetical protein VGF79_09315 [Bacteroidia bacterium]